jgi:hypothetical protein
MTPMLLEKQTRLPLFEGCFQFFIYIYIYFVYFNYRIAPGVTPFSLRSRGLFVFFTLVFLQLWIRIKGVLVFFINKKITCTISGRQSHFLGSAWGSSRWLLVLFWSNIQNIASPFTRWASTCQPPRHDEAPMIIPPFFPSPLSEKVC